MHKTTFNTGIGKVEYDAKGDLKNFEFAVCQVGQERKEDPAVNSRSRRRGAGV